MKTKKIDINSLKSIYKNSKKQVNNLKEKSKPVLEKAKQSYQTVINTVDKIINPPKAEVLKNKITEAQKHWVFDFNLHNSITSREGKIVEIFNIKKLL